MMNQNIMRKTICNRNMVKNIDMEKRQVGEVENSYTRISEMR